MYPYVSSMTVAVTRHQFKSIHANVCSVIFFFFQAEDGIRDLIVTGVQTCALPIYQVRQQEAVRRLNVVLLVRRLLLIARAHGMPDERQRHVTSAPIVTAAVPLFGTGAVALGREAVVEEEPRVALQRAESRAMREDDRRADEMARPFLAVFLLTRIEQHEVSADFRLRVVAVGRVEVGHMAGRVHISGIADTPAYVRDRDRARADQLDPRGTEERHGEKAREVATIRRRADVNRKGFDQVLASPCRR